VLRPQFHDRPRNRRRLHDVLHTAGDAAAGRRRGDPASRASGQAERPPPARGHSARSADVRRAGQTPRRSPGRRRATDPGPPGGCRYGGLEDLGRRGGRNAAEGDMIKIDRSPAPQTIRAFAAATFKDDDDGTMVTRDERERRRARAFHLDPANFANNKKLTNKRFEFAIYKDKQLAKEL